MNYLFRWAMALTVSTTFVVGCQEPERELSGTAGTGGVTGGGGVGEISGSGGEGGGSISGTGGTVDPGSGGSGGSDSDASPPGGGTGGTADAAVDQPITGGADTSIDVEPPPPFDAGMTPDVPIVQPPVPLMECSSPSLDRLQNWMVGSEANVVTTPMQGNILVREGNVYIGRVSFVGNGWHVVAVWVANLFNASVDLTSAGGFTLTYSSTAPSWVQLRPASTYGSGNHFLVALPSTGGQIQSKYIALTAAQWTFLPRLGMPTVTFANAVREVRGLVFVGDAANQLAFHGLRFDNYVPPCR